MIYIVDEKDVKNNYELVKRSIEMYNIMVYKSNYMRTPMRHSKDKKPPLVFE